MTGSLAQIAWGLHPCAMQDIFWPGIASMAFLYIAVFAVGVVASRSRTSDPGEGALEELMLAGRSLPLWVGLLTMTATWVGGGYINGTAEYTFSSGVLWGAQAGIGYALSLIIAGVFYARIMRRHGFTTLVDPLESRYGKGAAAVLMIPAVLAETFWSAAILVALGTTFGTVIGVALGPSIMVSAAVAIAYTVFGGLRAVAYTDVIQLILILVGLGLAVPFAVDAAGGLGALGAEAQTEGSLWLGSAGEWLNYGDWLILFMLGGIPWNVYFQRVLSSPDEDTAARTSMAAGVLCLLMAVPPLLLGLAGRSIDWSTLDTGTLDAAAALAETPAMILPLTLRYAVPLWVSVVGLGAVSAAVMSSVDSSMLSAASLISWNGYRRLLNPEATAEQVTRLVRMLVVVLGVFATVVALTVSSVAALWFLCGDIVYCVLFPQLTLALFDRSANRTGALSGFAISVGLRLLSGDSTLGIPAILSWPVLTADIEFPFRTVCMVSGLITAIVVSRVTAGSDPPMPLRNLGAS